MASEGKDQLCAPCGHDGCHSEDDIRAIYVVEGADKLAVAPVADLSAVGLTRARSAAVKAAGNKTLRDINPTPMVTKFQYGPSVWPNHNDSDWCSASDSWFLVTAFDRSAATTTAKIADPMGHQATIDVDAPLFL